MVGNATSNTLEEHNSPPLRAQENVLTFIPADISKPPDGGYGWVIVGCNFTINCFTWGVISAYGVTLSYYLDNNVFPGASSLDYALIGGLNFGVAMLAASPVNWITRRYGHHIPMFVGILLQSFGFIAASFCHDQIYQLYLSQGVLVGLGVGFLWIPSIAILPQWFEKKRSVANGICSAGSGIGGIVFSFATSAIIRKISLGWALRTTGIVSGGMNLIAAALIRSRNKEIQPYLHPFDLKLFKQLSACLLLAWGFIVMFGYITILYSLPDFSRSIGLSSSQGATVNAVLSLGTAVGRPLIGLLSDRYGRIEVTGYATLTCAITVFGLWLPAQSYGLLLLFALISGAILGVFWMAIGPLCAELVGLKELPSLLALNWAAVAGPTTFAEVIALKLRRPNSGRPYLYAQVFAGISYLVASAIMLALWYDQRRKKNSASLRTW
ncbi:MFS general substrate transporter [Tothia fuscella]|uniref:MFS general substrate transporter n=1 Tax=Tothia fuscella TaxID=1048955 RepID=A0A9P4P3L7_9PEZI|nr:MFS general substrate transporter [Tothia fuscella]